VIAGRYHLEREIGRGGMGAVWLARDELLDRSVALKRLGRDVGVDGEAVFRRAQREARLAATLSHPHVVSVLDLVIEQDQQWLVMEYVEGMTLAELVRREGRLSPDRTAGLLRQVADALAAAHRSGIVHRDVKPSNVLVTAAGLVKLTDFGIARATGDESLTQTGMVIGSPAYLAPEVVSGQAATAASDVWSLGATCYFALTGTPAYESGGDLMATLHRIVSEDPPRPDEPGWLAPLLEGTMSIVPGDRWPMSRVQEFLSHPRSPQAQAARLSRPPATSPPDGDTRLLAAPVRSAPAAERSRRALRWSGLAAAAVAVVSVLLAVLVWALPDRGQEPSGPGSSGSSSAPPTAAGMAAFIRTYVNTATTDQAAAWRMLTPEFQALSGSFADYRRAWQSRPEARVSRIDANPGNLTVGYDVAYFDAGGRPLFDDRVTLSLVYRNGAYLIAGES
jgi:serine/threonine protein kinase